MQPVRVYADTSVIGGCLDPEFSEFSLELLDQAAAGRLILVVSDLTLLELSKAPETIRLMLDEVPEERRERVAFTREAHDLAEAYIAAGVIGTSMRMDARHIATATVHQVDVLVSWNFKHIVNLKRVHGYNSVNLREGYALLEIRTPRELIYDGDEP